MAGLKRTKAKNRAFFLSWLAAIISGLSLGIFFSTTPANIYQAFFLFLFWGIIFPVIVYFIGRLIVRILHLSYFDYTVGYIAGYLGTYALGVTIKFHDLLKYPPVFMFIILIILLSFFGGMYIVSRIKRD